MNDQGIHVMAENAPLWPMMDGTYLGAALAGLLGGDMDFKIMDSFGDWIHLCARKCKWLGGGRGRGRGAERTDSSFPVMSILSTDFATFDIFRHMLDFKSSVSCLGLG